MAFLGIGRSKWNKIGKKAKSTFVGVKQTAGKGAMQTGKVLTTAGKVATIAGKAGVTATPFVTALNPALGATLATGSAGALAGGSLAKISGRGLKAAAKGKGGKFDAKRALMRD